jgi:putative SOS response-associated peptidase YedK
MCGRYMVLSSPEAIRRLFGYPEQPNFPPRYNVAPTQPVAIVRMVDGRREFALVRWGLIPPWVKDPRRFALLINARVESVNDKPAFRYAMRRRRCLVPADGFYDWPVGGAHRRPYCVRPKDRAPIAFAGLWETWMGPNGEEMETATIITTPANTELARLHERMPAIVPPAAFEAWLDCGRVDAETATALLAPAPEGVLEAYEVSPAVNRADNDGPNLIEPISSAAPATATAEAEAAAPAKRAKKPKTDERQSSLF